MSFVRQFRSVTGAIPAMLGMVLLIVGNSLIARGNGDEHGQPHGLTGRHGPDAYLSMPDKSEGVIPPLLSQTGAFKEVGKLEAIESLIPYDLNISFWSDGANKKRWIAVPNSRVIKFAATGEWTFPSGTVFVKHFELATDETKPNITRRLETRLLVCNATGGVYGVTYKWRADGSDAELLSSGLTENITVITATGMRTQAWYYPSREDCLTCHTPLNGGVLGVSTRQMNRDFNYPSGVTENQLLAWSHAGLFESKLDSNSSLKSLPKLASGDDLNRSLEDRARSHLDANCAHCHRPGGTVAGFDARYETPLAKQNLIGGRVLIDEGVDGARVIAPNDIWRSILYMRMGRLDGAMMPPLAHGQLDQQGLALTRQWIESLPGRPVLSPPEITPRGGKYGKAVTVELKSHAPGASIRYTLDGSVPTISDPLYEKPIKLSGPAVVRAKCFKEGFTKSITSQEVFNIGE